MLKRITALGVSRLVGASWVRRPGRTFCPQLVPPSSHGKIRYLQKNAFSPWSRKGLHQDHLVVCWSPCQKWPNIQENGCYCPPIGHIQDHIRWGRGMNSPISLCIVNGGSCQLLNEKHMIEERTCKGIFRLILAFERCLIMLLPLIAYQACHCSLLSASDRVKYVAGEQRAAQL